MGKASDTTTREERLAARLRENLHRRKQQARALGAANSGEAGGADNESAPLPKSPPKS